MINLSIYLNIDHVNGLEYIDVLLKENIPLSSILIIYNPKDSEKNKKIAEDRTQGLYKFKDFYSMMDGRKIPCYFLKSINSVEAADLIRHLKIDLLLLGASEIVHEETIKAPSMGILNCHPSDITRYRGCTNVEWAIVEDYPIFLSCHFITKKIDNGPLVYQEEFFYQSGMSYAELRTAVIHAQTRVMIKGLKKVLEKKSFSSEVPVKGEYKKVIPDDLMRIVHEKLSHCTYNPHSKVSDLLR